MSNMKNKEASSSNETKTMSHSDPTKTMATGDVTKSTGSIEVDKRGQTSKEELHIEIPAFIVKRKPKFKVTYSAKAEATPFTFFRIFVGFALLFLVFSIYHQQKKMIAMTKESKFQNLGKISEIGRKIGLLPPLIDENQSSTLNTIKLEPGLKNIKVTLNGQEVKIGTTFELYAPIKTELNIQIAADGIRPHIVQLEMENANTPYHLKPKYFSAKTGKLNLTTDKDVDIVLYLDGDVLIEKSSPFTDWSLPEGKYHALLQNDFLKIKKSVDFEIVANNITNVSETFAE